MSTVTDAALRAARKIEDLHVPPETSHEDFVRMMAEIIDAEYAAARPVPPQPGQGHGEPCYYCGEPCSSVAGNPGKWPLVLFHRDEPGKPKWHHAGCVAARLIENQPVPQAAAIQAMQPTPQAGPHRTKGMCEWMRAGGTQEPVPQTSSNVFMGLDQTTALGLRGPAPQAGEVAERLRKIVSHAPVGMPYSDTILAAADLLTAQAAEIERLSSVLHDERISRQEAVEKEIEDRGAALAAEDAAISALSANMDARDKEARGVIAHLEARIAGLEVALRQVRSRTYSSDRMCWLSPESIADISDVAIAALATAGREVDL